ncbi:hypothetical protein U1Q18_019800 [Sarracenia purpurea var. burkii]
MDHRTSMEMEGVTTKPLLHTTRFSRRTAANRLFAAIYACALFALLYRHAFTILHSASLSSFSISLSLLISDALLGFFWFAAQTFRLRPVYRQIFPENLEKVVKEKDFPAIDIFICTADPYKEPPVRVVNTALSVMAYDYPAEKLSVYVSDDGGSALTLFAFMEAAKFGRHWLPFCRKKKIVERSPDVYFRSNHPRCSETEQIKIMYESMKVRVENVVERGNVDGDYITSEQERQAFNRWTDKFSRHDHPSVIQVLLEVGKDKDTTEQLMPNLIYVSRQKSRFSPHHFKAGALNVLLRISAVMTNAPIILTLDCDMYSNDPQTPRAALCYFSDPNIISELGYVQFPQRFYGINKDDIYGCEFKHPFQINPTGMDGLAGPTYVGTGCFFSRRVFFGGPSSFVTPEILELRPDHVVDKLIQVQSQSTLALAYHVADCEYEKNHSNWGSKLGFKYGTVVEDFYTGYRLQCEGWKSVFCHPDRPAFLGDIPITLNDVLNQTQRWFVGFLEVAFSKYSPITFGVRSLGPIMGLCYSYYAFWALSAIPITVYAFLPQLTLLNGVSIFPKALDTWFFLYIFLFIGAYGHDCLDIMLAQGTIRRWWSDQRMWMIRGITCNLFGSIEFLSKHLGIAESRFNVTNKVVDDEQDKRYDQGIFEFGVESPLFVSLGMVAIINLAAFLSGLIRVARGQNLVGRFFVQIFIAGFVVLNCLPIYEAMVWRTDKGRLSTKTTIVSIFLAGILCTIAFLTQNI